MVKLLCDHQFFQNSNFIFIHIHTIEQITRHYTGCFTYKTSNNWKDEALGTKSLSLASNLLFKMMFLSQEQLSIHSVGVWNIYIAREGGLWESKAQLEPHSKKTDKGPEDSCSAALSLTEKKKMGTLLGKNTLI